MVPFSPGIAHLKHPPSGRAAGVFASAALPQVAQSPCDGCCGLSVASGAAEDIRTASGVLSRGFRIIQTDGR